MFRRLREGARKVQKKNERREEEDKWVVKVEDNDCRRERERMK